MEKWTQCSVSNQVTRRRAETTIMSINYPSNYDNYYDEEWTLEGSDGHIIQLTFESFDIEDHSSCGYDWVEV